MSKILILFFSSDHLDYKEAENVFHKYILGVQECFVLSNK